jgi:predicted RNA-binding Zn ribbon-like protein
MINTSEEQSKEVPDQLSLLQAFVNTQYGQPAGRHFHSELTRPEHLRTWLVQHHLLLTDETPISEGDFRRTLQLRETLRALLRANNESSDPLASQLEILNHLASNAPLTVHFEPNGSSTLQPDVDGVDGVIAHLIGMVFTSMTDGTWARLKACRNDRCQKAFYDSSKNRSGTWCSMATCGSRLKANAYRQRHMAHPDA